MELTDEREALRDALRGLLTGYPPRPAPAGHDAGLWGRLCKEIGVAGLTVPEEYGGAGATLLEACVVLEELGRVLSPAPMLGAVLAAEALLRSGDADARARLLPALCAGERIIAPALAGDVTAGAGRLTGAVPQVLDLTDADTLLTPAHDGFLYEVEATAPGVTREPSDPLDLTRGVGVLRLDAAPARRLGRCDPAALRDLACVALSAEQVGGAAQAFTATLGYVRVREQFGRPIGSFQALQHRLAEAHVRLEAARSASHAAAEAYVSGAPDLPRRAAVAKVYCSEAFQAITAEMVQMHGGLAITWEHDAHLYLRRAHASAQLFGAPAEHVARLADTLLPV